jgi:hypothetical protein
VRRPARLRTPLFGYGAPHLSAKGTSTLLNNALLSAHFRLADHPHKAAAHAIPLSRRSDANLNFRLSRWTDALRLFVVVYCVSRFVNIILRNDAVLFVTTP